MQSILDKYKKAKQAEIEKLKRELSYYLDLENNLMDEIKQLEEKISSLSNIQPDSPLGLQIRSSFYTNLKYKISERYLQLEKSRKKIDKIKEQISYLLGEKKAVEKYDKKIKKRKEKKAERDMQRLYDDIFSNRSNNWL